MPPTLIASIYGMNFKAMPELEWLGRRSGARESANHDVQLHIGESRDPQIRDCVSGVWCWRTIPG